VKKNAHFVAAVAIAGMACSAPKSAAPTSGTQPPASARASSEQPRKSLAPAARGTSAAAVDSARRAEKPPSYPFQEPIEPQDAGSVPAMRFAKLTSGQCRAELRKRKLSTKPARRAAPGVATPLRISGPLHGVEFLAPGARSVYGTLDCRLLLALDELAQVLERHGVIRVHVDNLYRPRAHLPGKRKRSQHAYGLAADIRALELSDGRQLVVERDWSGPIASAPCGPSSALAVENEQAVALRNIVCDVVRQGVFHHVLTPSYDAAHVDHVHLDIKRDARTIIVR